MPTATPVRCTRNARITIATDTAIVAPAKSHDALPPSPNAPPEFCV